ncbi:nucleotidyltransferase family protein [Prosthecomicrobium pneumaticum]|uniref:Nucleotidyltransferase family protein n=1 Tax=Prosthecomicrobium pneumaticum TaxID=81895 RepID=A0A7W9FKV4_9HYPH|nr:nucleotidyltransferase family protein [Prosthecomicrobium pneumaticum]MBB5751648.1 hypothetical protein [Prosthecomicrobium pneumaticum]
MGGFVERTLRSGWPTGSIDLLLRAATLADSGAAAEAWHAFEAAADFDALPWGEYRLISLAAPRIAMFAPASPYAPRIAGIERAIWSRSQLAIGAVSPVLRRLAAAGIELLAVKGAARAASGDLSARGRIVNDIDVCVRPVQLEAAYDIVTGAGWIPSGSGTVLYHRSQLADAVGINLLSGRFGNLDLHRTPFHSPFDNMEADREIWRHARAARLGGVAVLIPDPTDTTTLAIAHGVHDAHKSSDWLADIAHMADQGIDWDRLEDDLVRRRLDVAGALVLGYVRERLQRPVPEGMLRRLEGRAGRHPLRLLATVAEARPKNASLGFFWTARLFAKQMRHGLARRRKRVRSRLVLPALRLPPAPSPTAESAGPEAIEAAIALPGVKAGHGWRGLVDLAVEAELPPATRRVDFEINTAGRHHLRLRAYVRDKGARRGVFRFRFRLALEPGETGLAIAAAPSRSFNTDAPAEMHAKYDAVPFRLIAARAVPSAG